MWGWASFSQYVRRYQAKPDHQVLHNLSDFQLLLLGIGRKVDLTTLQKMNSNRTQRLFQKQGTSSKSVSISFCLVCNYMQCILPIQLYTAVLTCVKIKWQRMPSCMKFEIEDSYLASDVCRFVNSFSRAL